EDGIRDFHVTGVQTCALPISGLCEALAARGHEVDAVVAKPHYPEWRIRPEYRGLAAQTSRENGVSVTRVPLYVPANPTGAQRIQIGRAACRARVEVVVGGARS